MRGLTHRAVDETAGLPPGSTSNHARTRAALLETAVRRLAERDRHIVSPNGIAALGTDVGQLTEAIAVGLHALVTEHPEQLAARYELALEANRRPELRAYYDRVGIAAFREPLVALMRALGSAEPERHALSIVIWCEGVLFSCSAGSYRATAPDVATLRTSTRELLDGMLGAPGPGGTTGSTGLGGASGVPNPGGTPDG